MRSLYRGSVVAPVAMADHSCAMGISLFRCASWRAKRHLAPGHPSGGRFLWSTRAHTERVAGWGSGMPEPACLSCRLASVAHMQADPTDATAEAQMTEELTSARQRLLAADPADVVVNHAIGLYELGAIHLANTPPDLSAAALAIDGLACLVEGLQGRLGDNEATLRDALGNIRLAFVQIKATVGA